MKRTLLSILVIGILLLSACGAPTTAPSEDISELENRIASLESQLAERESTISDLETQLDAKSKRISALEKRVVELEALPEETTAPTPSTFEPIVITGSSDKTSPPFTVTTKEWLIDWSYVPDPEYPEFAIFSFFVFPRGETIMFVESVSTGFGTGGTSGSTYSYSGAGEYYIQVIAGNVNSWEVVISPP